MLKSQETAADTRQFRFISHLFEIVDSADWEGLPEVFHPDIIYDRPGFELIVGLNSLRRFYEVDRIIASGRHRIETIVENGDSAVCFGSFQGLSRKADPLKVRFADYYRFRDQRVIERSTYFGVPAV